MTYSIEITLGSFTYFVFKIWGSPRPLFPYIKIEGFGVFHPPFGDDVIYERSQSTESNQRYQYAARHVVHC